SYFRSNMERDPQSAIEATASAMAPTTNAPVSTGLVFLAMRFLHGAVLTSAREKFDDAWIFAVGEQLARRSCRDLGMGRSVEEHAVVADGEDAGELVSHDHERCTEARPEIEDQLVEAHGSNRIQTSRRLVQK